jgi:tetratricopeptide (TPR) repeat protein
VGWLLQEAGAAARRRLSDQVVRALTRVVEAAVSRAVAQIYVDAGQREHTTALLKERPASALPLVDGAPFGQLATVVGRWVASIEAPVDEDGHLPPVKNLPLAQALYREILAGIQAEALRGEGVLYPLWSDHQRTIDTGKILAGIEDVQRSVSESSSGHAERTAYRPARIDYWHPPIAHPGRFVGRDAELTWLSAPDRGPMRLVHGIGGVGKTALVLAFADRVGDALPDGRVFVDFHSYSEHARHHRKSAEQALAELLPLCGVDDRLVVGMDLRQRELLWKQAISGRRMLFVWDNVDSLAQIEPLLTGQPDCLTLVTSRSELDIPAGSLRLGHLTEHDAVELFAAVAAGKPDRLDQGLMSDAVRLCAWMPLQIMVHAASVRRRRSLAELVTELAKLPAGDRLARLFASLDLSYQEFTEEVRRAWRVLGAHPGPHLTAGTAAAMLGCAVEEAVKLLDELVDANFAERYRGRFDRYGGGHEIVSEPRFYAYTAHDLLRDYALDRAARSTDEVLVHINRLLDHYWERLTADLDRAWIQVERACIVLALWLVEPNEDSRDFAMQAGSRLREAGWYLDAEVADRYALRLYRETQAQDGEAYALWGLAQSAMTRGDHEQATEHLQAALTINREIGERQGQADVLTDLGMSAIFLGRHREGFAALEEALAISRELGDGDREFSVLLQLAQQRFAVSAATRADVDRAARQARALLRLGQKLDERRRAAAFLFLAQVKEAQRANKAAIEAYRSALEIFETIGHRHGMANADFGIGTIALTRGDYVQAATHLRKALATYREVSDRVGEAKTLAQMAEVAIAHGALSEAKQLLLDAHTTYQQSGFPLGQAATAKRLAEVASAMGQDSKARVYLQESLSLLETIDSPHANKIRQQLDGLTRPSEKQE